MLVGSGQLGLRLYMRMQQLPATAVLSLKNDEEIIGLSGRFQDLLGWTEDDLLGASVAKVLSDAGFLTRFDSGRDTLWTEVTALRPDGSRLQLDAELQRWSAGDDRFATVSLRPRQAGVEPLSTNASEAQARFDALLDASPDGIVITDETGLIEMFNSSAESLFGLSEDEVRGASLARLFPNSAQHPVTDSQSDFLAELRRDATGNAREFRARRGDGSLFPVEVSVGQSSSSGDRCFIVVVRDITRRQNAAAALALSESNLRMSQALAHLGSFEFNYLSDEPMYWSDEVFRIIGLDPAAGVPDVAFLRDRILHPDDRQRIVQAIAAARQHGGVLELNYRILRSDGTMRHVQTAARVLPAADPGSFRISGTVLDVSDRRRIERALREERDRAELYLDLVGVMVIAVDNNGNITMINRQGLETLGAEEEEVIGRNFFQLFIPEEYRKRVLADFNKLIESDDNLLLRLDEGWVETRGGQRRLVRWRNKKLLTASGMSIGVLVAGEDITEQRRIGDQLKQAEQELRLTFQHAPIGMATLDVDGHVLSVNQSLCTMLGYPQAELLGLPMRDLIHPDDRAVALGLLKRLLGGEIEYVRHERRYQRKDGSLMFGIVRYSLIKSFHDRPLMFVAQIVDRTEQIEAEVEVRQHRERLAQVSRLGTMGEMAAGLAHELNQPLTAIANYVQACQHLIDADAIARDDLKEVLGKVAHQARRAGQVIHGLRSFVKRRTVSRTDTDLHRVVRDVMMLAELDGRANGVPITSESDEILPLVQADPIQLQQVLLNLVRNAVDAMAEVPHRNRGVLVSTRRLGEDEVGISVIDHGHGISSEDATRIFDPFFTTKTQGMGMGLSLSRSIVESHGGRLLFTDNPSGGTIFTMALPTLPEEQP